MKYALEEGQRFGRGVVIAVRSRNGKRGATLQCDCGKTYWTQASNLHRTPGTLSCGCLKAEYAREGKRSIHHPHDAWCSVTITGN